MNANANVKICVLLVMVMRACSPPSVKPLVSHVKSTVISAYLIPHPRAIEPCQ